MKGILSVLVLVVLMGTGLYLYSNLLSEIDYKKCKDQKTESVSDIPKSFNCEVLKHTRNLLK